MNCSSRLCRVEKNDLLYDYLKLMISFFAECMCSIDGSVSKACDDKTGICVCKESYTDNKCDRCKSGYYGYPNCEGT